MIDPDVTGPHDPEATTAHNPAATTAHDPDATTAHDPDATTAHDPAAPAASGRRVRYIGDYELISLLGRGGMGVVYRARQITLNRQVALKLISNSEFASEDQVRRFQNEAEAVAALDHRGIVPIYEVGTFEDQRVLQHEADRRSGHGESPRRPQGEPARGREDRG